MTVDGDSVIDTEIDFDKTYRYMYFAASTGSCTDDHYIRNVRFTGRAAYSNASEWAISEMDKAETYNLIPETLKGKDMTKVITRREFAALSVRLYESITSETLPENLVSPFEDVLDSEVTKAYYLGITQGISDTLFAPEKDISREEVATMLTRTLAACELNIDMNYNKEFRFADDEYISDWAKSSVYYMADKKIILGIGDNKFAPKNTTANEEAVMYANSTREQALLMAVRSYELVK